MLHLFLFLQDGDKMTRDSLSSQKLSMNWCFLDCKSTQNICVQAQRGS